MRYILEQDVNKLCEMVSDTDIKNRRIEKLRAAQSSKSSI
jgi:hypothetical protein